MGLSCKPIGKLASLHRKMQNELLKEEKAMKKVKTAKKADK